MTMKLATILQAVPNAHPKIRPATAWHLLAVHAIIVADVFVMTYTDPLPSPAFIAHILLFSLQCFLLVAILLAFFILTSSTPIVQLGLYDRYLKQHRLYFLIAAASLACFLGVGAYGIVLAAKGQPLQPRWEEPLYFGLWVLQRAAVLLFQCSSAYAAVAALTGFMQGSGLPLSLCS